MFWINKTRAEKAAKIIAGYCDKQLRLYVASKNSIGLGNAEGGRTA